MNKLTKIHIITIIIGIIFILIPVFHTNLWFDESYSVAISNHGFGEIWTIGGNDVHPVLYYWILHIIRIIFGSKILLYRLFSVLCTAILGIIGYTHIRKDFGEKTGILFSFLVFFFPVNVVYAGEIRMYSLAMLLVTLMSIYAYRICRNKDKKYVKNWVLFAIFSLASAYTHYYGLMMAGLINLFLFISFTIQVIREKKFTYNLKAFIVSALSQILLYVPWIMSLFKQVKGVSSGFWIGIHFPDTFIELFTFPFTGNLGDTVYIAVPMAILFAIIVWGYMIYIHIKNKKEQEIKPARLSLFFWIMVVLGACIVSLIIRRPIIYARYLLCVGGLFVFFMAGTMAMKGNKTINIIVLTISATLSVMVICALAQENYGKVNQELQSYISQNVQEKDIIICANEGSGFVLSAYYPNNKMYFYDLEHWNVGPAYKAYGETIYDFEFLKEYKGRIWIANNTNFSIYDEISKQIDLKLIEQKDFNVEYKNYQYKLTLVEK